MLRIFLIALSLTSLTQALVVNKLMDSILKTASLELKEEGKTTLPIPDMKRHFELNLKGDGKEVAKGTSGDIDLAVEGGTFTDLSSFKRNGDSTLISSGDLAKLTFSVTFETFKVNFNKYHLTFNKVNETGSLKLTITNNSLSGTINIERKGNNCTVSVEKASIDTLTGFHSELGPNKDFGKFGELFLEALLDEFNSNYKLVWYDRLKQALDSALAAADLCSKI